MILIGQYDSPFVRRVGIALSLYGLAFAHRPWSVMGETERIAALNPLVRVPTLLLDDGEVLVDSVTILDHLDTLVPEAARLVPSGGPERRAALRLAALAMGAAEKAVSLFYELRFHPAPAESWVARCRMQILGTLAALEHERAARPGPFWFGDTFGHADIALGCALRFIAEAHPGLVAAGSLPALAAQVAAMEALPVFRAVEQPFIPPA